MPPKLLILGISDDAVAFQVGVTSCFTRKAGPKLAIFGNKGLLRGKGRHA